MNLNHLYCRSSQALLLSVELLVISLIKYAYNYSTQFTVEDAEQAIARTKTSFC